MMLGPDFAESFIENDQEAILTIKEHHNCAQSIGRQAMIREFSGTDPIMQCLEQRLQDKEYICALCGGIGELGKDLHLLRAAIGGLTYIQLNKYNTTLEVSFCCEDEDACEQQRRAKNWG